MLPVMLFSSIGSALRSDLAAKGHASDRPTVMIYRFGQYSTAKRRRILQRIVFRGIDLVWTRVVVGAELPPSADIGPGLRLPHWGRGVIVHPRAVIGKNAFIYHGVTIGESKGGTPVIGDDVYIGANATIIGPVRIGHGVRIGAGAVVVRDISSGSTAVGSTRVLPPSVNRTDDFARATPQALPT